MLMRRKLPVSIFLAGMLTFIAILGVGAQQTDLGGSANFRDSNAASDSLVLKLTGVPAPPAGFVYEGWLKGGSGALASAGVLSRSGTGAVNQTYQSPSDANLLATYSQFVITEEPVNDPDPATPGTIIWSDTVPAGVFPNIAHLVVGLASNPGGIGIAVGARTQAQVAADHAALAKNSTTLASQQDHAQHVINAVDGLGAPGDSVGIIAYANAAIAHAGFAKSATTDAGVIATADAVIAAANNTIAHANSAKGAAQRIIAASASGLIVNLELANVVNASKRALNGTDDNGDGVRGNAGPEGGAKSIYTFSQDLGMFVPLAGSPSDPPPTGDALVPLTALLVLAAGIVLTAGGGLLVFRRRSAA
jgi:hypothetical protein